jgi:hypothetical protein
MIIIKLNQLTSFVKAIVPKNLAVTKANKYLITLQDFTISQMLQSSSSETISIKNSPSLIAPVYRNNNDY